MVCVNTSFEPTVNPCAPPVCARPVLTLTLDPCMPPSARGRGRRRGAVKMAMADEERVLQKHLAQRTKELELESSSRHGRQRRRRSTCATSSQALKRNSNREEVEEHPSGGRAPRACAGQRLWINVDTDFAFWHLAGGANTWPKRGVDT